MDKRFWIEKSWGGSIDNAGPGETAAAFEEIKKTGHHARAFWIGCGDLQYVLKIQKDLELVLIYGENQDIEIKKKAADWQEVSVLTALFLKSEFTELQLQMQRSLDNKIVSK